VDSILNPPVDDVDDWIVVRSYDESVKWMQTHPFPHYISFGHTPDQPEGKTSLDFAEWLIQFDRSNGKMPYDFDFNVHAADRSAAIWLRAKMATYCWFKHDVDWGNPLHKKGPISIDIAHAA
jgi:hypothetical protein